MATAAGNRTLLMPILGKNGVTVPVDDDPPIPARRRRETAARRSQPRVAARDSLARAGAAQRDSRHAGAAACRAR